MITGQKPRTKNEMMKGLKPGFVRSKLTGRNTIKAEYPDGSVIIRYWDTDVVTINPDKSIVLNSGGFMTKTTKERIEEFTRIRIMQKDSIWYIIRNIHNGYPLTNEGLPLFYDGIHISDDGKILSGVRVNPEKTVRQFKKDLTNLANMITKESLPGYFADMAGDCLICKFDLSSGKLTTDHLINHVKEKYMHGSLIALCLKNSGYGPGVLSVRHVDLIRRAVRRVISDTCIPVIANNPSEYNEVS